MLNRQWPNCETVVGKNCFMHYKKLVVATEMEDILQRQRHCNFGCMKI
jgi:hypothetical protein